MLYNRNTRNYIKAKSLQVENVRNVLEVLLEKSLAEEKRISKEQSDYKKKHDLPFLDDEKKDTAAGRASTNLR